DQRTGRHHVRADAYVDAMGRRILQSSARQLPGRLGRRPALRHPGQLRLDVVDLGRAWRVRRGDPLVDSRAAGAAAGDGRGNMSAIRTRIRNGRFARLFGSTPAGQFTSRAEPLPDNTPYWLLWSTGIVAFVLGIVAFVLWGFGGASTLFD